MLVLLTLVNLLVEYDLEVVPPLTLEEITNYMTLDRILLCLMRPLIYEC